ncbi:SRPBCC family protein [Streptomyces sp. NPDC050560]|uniref:SRPBCC family protein n=1 Tax=Streptomyces sp. NPDC050560 TaxID=3365630 RepID=UPI0037917988
MDWSRYRFHSVWTLPAPPHTVFAVLSDIRAYPAWWPQVREVATRDGTSGSARFRSLLPYDLVVTAHEERNEPGTGILQIRMRGDLDGWARWRVAAAAPGVTRAVYDQDVEVRKPLMRRLAVPCRPVFRLNHALMMRAGRRGLIALLTDGSRPAPH